MSCYVTAVLILLTAVVPGVVFAEGAGVIAYTKIQGKTYVLLADHTHSNRGWATFGGNLDGQTTKEAALREFHEETRCVYSETTIILEEERSVKTSGFVAYVAEVKFVPANFFAGIEGRQVCTGWEYQERGPWAWIPVSSLRESLARGSRNTEIEKHYLPSGHHGKLWPVAAESLQIALDEGLIP